MLFIHLRQSTLNIPKCLSAECFAFSSWFYVLNACCKSNNNRKARVFQSRTFNFNCLINFMLQSAQIKKLSIEEHTDSCLCDAVSRKKPVLFILTSLAARLHRASSVFRSGDTDPKNQFSPAARQTNIHIKLSTMKTRSCGVIRSTTLKNCMTHYAP